MYLGDHARLRPDHPALIDAGSGAVLTYGELDARSNRLAHLLRAEGLKRGDVLALYMENNPRFLEIAWAALRSGLYLTAVNRYLTSQGLAGVQVGLPFVVVMVGVLGSTLLALAAGTLPAQRAARIPARRAMAGS